MAKISYYVAVFLCFLHISAASQCKRKNPCSCNIDDFTFINLAQLRPAQGKFFQDARSDVSYFFSGCENKDFHGKDFNLIYNGTIPAVSLVKCNTFPVNITVENTTIHTINQTCKSLGVAQQIQFDLVSGSTNQYQLIFKNKTSNDSLPSIHLDCVTYNETALTISSPDTDALSLYSPLVCIQRLEHHELSFGSVFCVVFFVTAFVYFVGGGSIMYFGRGARGIEIIPNFDFWVSIPGLVKDGMIYVLSGCRPFTVSTAETYDRI